MKNNRLFTALLALLMLVFPPAIFAHGDEDHGDKKPAVAAGPGVIARTARAGDFEVLLKHPAFEPLHEHSARIFITRYETNEPVKDATVKLVIAGKGAAPINVTAKQSSRPGEFEVTLPPLDHGSYNLSVEVGVGGTSGTAGYGAVAVEEAKAAAVENENASGLLSALPWLLWLGAMALASLTGFFFWRRRALLQPEA